MTLRAACCDIAACNVRRGRRARAIFPSTCPAPFGWVLLLVFLSRHFCYNFIFATRLPGHYDTRRPRGYIGVAYRVHLRARVYLRRAFKRYAGVWPLLCPGISAHWCVNLGLPRNFYRGRRAWPARVNAAFARAYSPSPCLSRS